MTKRELIIELIVQKGLIWDELYLDMALTGYKTSLTTIKKFLKGDEMSDKMLERFTMYVLQGGLKDVS